MSLESQKIEIVKQIFSVDEESVLKQIKEILDEKVVAGYTAKGEPLSLAEYNRLLKVAEEDVEYGRTTTSEDLKREMKSWRKS